MNRLIFDTNILIYLDKGEEKYENFFISHANYELCISVITYTEFLIGKDKSPDTARFLNQFKVINLIQDISDIAIDYLRLKNKKSLRNPNVLDIIIGSTAECFKYPLVTNNPKDFAIFKHLEIIVP